MPRTMVYGIWQNLTIYILLTTFCSCSELLPTFCKYSWCQYKFDIPTNQSDNIKRAAVIWVSPHVVQNGRLRLIPPGPQMNATASPEFTQRAVTRAVTPTSSLSMRVGKMCHGPVWRARGSLSECRNWLTEHPGSRRSILGSIDTPMIEPYPYGGFLKQGYPQIIHFSRVFPYKSSILGYPHFGKPPYDPSYRADGDPLHSSRKVGSFASLNMSRNMVVGSSVLVIMIIMLHSVYT